MANFDGYPALAVAKGVSTTVGDTFIATPNGAKGMLIEKVTFTNPSTSLASSTTTAGLYTATAAGGTAIVTSATGNLTPLTSAAVYKDGTVAATTAVITPSVQTTANQSYTGQAGLFINVGGTNNVAGTFDVYIYGRVLT